MDKGEATVIMEAAAVQTSARLAMAKLAAEKVVAEKVAAEKVAAEKVEDIQQVVGEEAEREGQEMEEMAAEAALRRVFSVEMSGGKEGIVTGIDMIEMSVVMEAAEDITLYPFLSPPLKAAALEAMSMTNRAATMAQARTL
jgi:membrane protein involved in colicin uptake